MEEKKSKNLVVVVVVLALLVLLLGGYLVYDKVLSSTENEQDTNNVNDNNNEDDDDDTDYINRSDIDYKDFSKDNFAKIIDVELKYLTGKNSLSELSDSEKSYMVMNIYSKENIYGVSSVSTSTLDGAKDNSSLRNLKFNYDEIKYFDRMGINLNEITEPLYYLNGNKYSKAETGHGSLLTDLFMYDSELKNENGKYTFTCKYVFSRSTGDGPGPLQLFYSVEDIKNKSFFKVIEDSENQKQELQTYLDDNYNNIKDKLKTYNYVFDTSDGVISLVDYYVN